MANGREIPSILGLSHLQQFAFEHGYPEQVIVSRYDFAQIDCLIYVTRGCDAEGQFIYFGGTRYRPTKSKSPVCLDWSNKQIPVE